MVQQLDSKKKNQIPSSVLRVLSEGPGPPVDNLMIDESTKNSIGYHWVILKTFSHCSKLPNSGSFAEGHPKIEKNTSIFISFKGVGVKKQHEQNKKQPFRRHVFFAPKHKESPLAQGKHVPVFLCQKINTSLVEEKDEGSERGTDCITETPGDLYVIQKRTYFKKDFWMKVLLNLEIGPL